MNRTLVILFLIFSSVFAHSANTEKQYKKLIENFDVADEAKSVAPKNVEKFWVEAIGNNELCLKFIQDMKKNKGAEKEAINKTAQLPRFYPQYDETIIESMQGFCDTLLMDMGIADLGLKCSLHIVESNEINAFTALTEDGFAMCITTGLASKKGMNYDILMGYVAHEFAHGALLHHARGFYAEAKERRKNELLGGIAAGLNGLAAGMEAYNAAAYGIPTSGTDYGARIASISDDIKSSTLKYSFKYSREQEYEADLIAYRFLEHLGAGEEFINGLRILGTAYDALYNEYSDHPTISSRIDFLKYVQKHPELGNKKNAKLKRKREEPEFEW
ncbi:MAG: M48 family metalloprotease [Lachnospiraceae bacterium]|nr:M48 family metalloprotease [Lachnospiraceae bacterium]